MFETTIVIGAVVLLLAGVCFLMLCFVHVNRKNRHPRAATVIRRDELVGILARELACLMSGAQWYDKERDMGVGDVRRAQERFKKILLMCRLPMDVEQHDEYAPLDVDRLVVKCAEQ
ncbi:MAG: hypothetical protein C4532_14155 [Candidatus Abyssobacteria bacterium SURF_17]|uniref:Uncharacterized protein n=1 Tax=Candidatus Abyssobacteria bacterium SURF_17 TaxID=2093361 RepID=A0A419EUA1_9BACT|nr:MAG: hypothetical protein C4532_14155 [Candidatus Abyssubacteria bacterium SURF_17]